MNAVPLQTDALADTPVVFLNGARQTGTLSLLPFVPHTTPSA